MLVLFALLLAAGASVETLRIPFLLIEGAAVYWHVRDERERWYDR